MVEMDILTRNCHCNGFLETHQILAAPILNLQYYLDPDRFTLHKQHKETPILYLFSVKARYYGEVLTEKISFLPAKNTK